MEYIHITNIGRQSIQIVLRQTGISDEMAAAIVAAEVARLKLTDEQAEGIITINPGKSIGIELDKIDQAQIIYYKNRGMIATYNFVVEDGSGSDPGSESPIPEQPVHLTWWLDYNTIYAMDSGGIESTTRMVGILERMHNANICIPVPQSTYINIWSPEAAAWFYPLVLSTGVNVQMLIGNSYIYGYARASVPGDALRTWYGTPPAPAPGEPNYTSPDWSSAAAQVWMWNEALHTNFESYPAGSPGIHRRSIACTNYRGSRYQSWFSLIAGYYADLIDRGMPLPLGSWIDHETYHDPRRYAYSYGDGLYTGCTRCQTLAGAVTGYEATVIDHVNQLRAINPEMIISFFRGFNFVPGLPGDGAAQYFPAVDGYNYPEPGLYNSCQSSDPIGALNALFAAGLPVAGGRPTLSAEMSVQNTYDFCTILASHGAVGVTFYWDGTNKVGTYTWRDEYLLSRMEAANQAFVDAL